MCRRIGSRRSGSQLGRWVPGVDEGPSTCGAVSSVRPVEGFRPPAGYDTPFAWPGVCFFLALEAGDSPGLVFRFRFRFLFLLLSVFFVSFFFSLQVYEYTLEKCVASIPH